MPEKKVSKINQQVRKAIAKGDLHSVERLYRRNKTTQDVQLLSNIGLALLKHADRCKTCSARKKRQTEQMAADLFKKMLRHNKNSVDALLGLATLCYYRQDRQALAFIRRVIRLTKNKAFVIHIGHFYRRTGDLKKAERYYREALPFVKKHYGGFYALATLYRDLGQNAIAKKYAKIALKKLAVMDAHYATDPVVQNYKQELLKIKEEAGQGPALLGRRKK